jgi:hypothetical protein
MSPNVVLPELECFLQQPIDANLPKSWLTARGRQIGIGFRFTRRANQPSKRSNEATTTTILQDERRFWQQPSQPWNRLTSRKGPPSIKYVLLCLCVCLALSLGARQMVARSESHEKSHALPPFLDTVSRSYCYSLILLAILAFFGYTTI